jgi:leucyl aminopeptidase
VTSLTLSNSSPSSLKVDALVVGVAIGRKGPDDLVVADAADVEKAFRGKLRQTLASLGATGTRGEVTKVPSLGAIPADVLVAVGLGDVPAGRGATYDLEVLRRGAGDATRALAGTRKTALALPADTADAVAAISEGALMGAYTYSRYRFASKSAHKPEVESVTVVTPAAKDKAAKAAAARAEILADAVHLTRDLVNTPPSDLHPTSFAEAAIKAAKSAGAQAEVVDEKALKKGGYGGILGVGQGSTNPPVLLRFSWRGPNPRRSIAFVGKGITFDSGGLSLKPSKSMETMKCDMGGAAAVVAAVAAIARLGLRVDVTAWAPLAENMPSGTAQRPSDVLTMYGGKTVEVLNTDAEGRLVLADALVRASEDKPDLIVDVATLTGAQLVALGSRTAGIMANDDEVREQVFDASRRAGEAMWPMPLPPELRKSMDSEIADIQNIGDRNGGMLVAGLFLKEFVPEGRKWAHIDIAGPAFNEGEPYGYTPKGGTGAAVRTLVQLAEDAANGVV